MIERLQQFGMELLGFLCFLAIVFPFLSLFLEACWFGPFQKKG